ncbi:GNAT family N-acetyltransferase [Terriglobus saanensis]|uniref:GCN5-related N-acetyltransferase n=1 Tax=Terriglobus saanensis (strain ATCC BAA-1853 / DSM 23119 / SP1PR4) TaxID=401053 RepID=E8UY51_TERSS|nr:GNAT family N-acetyltransferase [Terriglobus saanensis]ADV80861.1 GCN5-related N-acetyltransferase [Terriglobus saanensis SP1PR4]
MTTQTFMQVELSPQLFSRIATKQDLSLLVSFINQAFKDENPFITESRTNMEEIAHFLEIGHFLLIEEEGETSGVIYAEIRKEGRGYLGLLVVNPKNRRSGMGKQLIHAGEQFCKQHGCRLIEGSVMNLRPDLLERYKRYGFRVVGEIAGVHRDRVDRDYSLILIEKDL